jgi:hypothetical protein
MRVIQVLSSCFCSAIATALAAVLTFEEVKSTLYFWTSRMRVRENGWSPDKVNATVGRLNAT